MTRKTKHLHNIAIEGCQISTKIHYNTNTDHIGIGTTHEYQKQQSKQYYEDNKEQFKQYRENNKEKIKQQSKQYYENNKEQIKQQWKQYYENNKEQLKQQSKQYYENNKDQIKQQSKQYYEDNRDPNSSRMGSEEFRIKCSCSHQGIDIEDFNGFVTDKTQPHLTPINQCIQLNKRFKGSNGHHITIGVVIFLPKNLHQSISHSLKTGKNMLEINKLAYNYLMGSF